MVGMGGGPPSADSGNLFSLSWKHAKGASLFLLLPIAMR